MTILDIRPALRSFLIADAGISSAVGGNRVYPLRLPQGDQGPSIVYQRISDVGDHHMDGPTGLARPRFQIDAWAQTADAASSLANLIKNRLDGHKGATGSTTIQGAFFDSMREGYDPESKLFYVGQDFFIWYAER